ncbi:MAG: menaquinone biosynthesis protein [Nitrospirae bacterium]|nr:menaquinone biosynthesis protein [Nitrospirota bacterium]
MTINTINRERRNLLRIGKIPFANLFPIFYELQNECDCSHYDFIEGVPSLLNRKLRSGEIDLSPSSSIEYLRYKDRYVYIDGHSLSSKGAIESILLISRIPIDKLRGIKVFTTSQSDTSVVLLNIILRKFSQIECYFESTDEKIESLLNEADAFLCIGDDALKAKRIITNHKLQIEKRIKNAELRTPNSGLIYYIYDLGDLWFKNTGLPFVFALWIVRKDSLEEKPDLISKFTYDLDKSKRLAKEHLNKIASALKQLLFENHGLLLKEQEILSYWKCISFDLTEEHKRGLGLFRKYSEELGLL